MSKTPESRAEALMESYRAGDFDDAMADLVDALREAEGEARKEALLDAAKRIEETATEWDRFYSLGSPKNAPHPGQAARLIAQAVRALARKENV